MNNERYNQVIDEAYENYLEKMVYHPEENWLDDGDGCKTYRQLKKQEFIDKCKTDTEFSEKWGLKIEERELSTVKERKKYDKHFDDLIGEYPEHHVTLDKRGVPRKIITVTYKDEKIESYE